jgi:catalase
MNFQRDGQMQMAVPKGRANYEPNSLAAHGEAGGPRECPVTGFHTFEAATGPQEQGDKLRIRAELFADHYSQARLFWISQTPSEQAHIASSFVFELSKVSLSEVPARVVGNLLNVDSGLAKRVAEGRKIGILIADGSDAKALAKLIGDIRDADATPFVVAPKVGKVKLSDGKMVKADGQLAGSPSQLFDAVAVLLSDEGCRMLLREGAAVQWVMDAFGHLKAIAYTEASKPLIDKAGVEPDDGVAVFGGGFLAAAAKRYWDREPKVRLLA